jgi:exonuclease III
MMKILTWNIRGLNGRSKQRTLRECIKVENPDLLLLQETKCAGAEAEIIFQRIWRDCNFISTDAAGASGGLAILWNPASIRVYNPFSTVGTLTASFQSLARTRRGTSRMSMAPKISRIKTNSCKG